MARGTMNAPKPGAARRNSPTHADQVVVADNRRRGPALVGEYGPETLAWYMTWRTSPQAQLFEATDWQRLQLLAPIVEGYYRKPSAAALGEIRMNEERLGATVVDRMRARIRVERPERTATAKTAGAVGSNVTPINARRQSVAARLAPALTPPAPAAKDLAPF